MAKVSQLSKRRQAAAAPAPTAPPELNSEFANRLRDPFEQTYMGVLQPNDPLLMERGDSSAAIYSDLKRDGKVFDGLQKRQLALVGKPWQVEPVQESEGATKDAETITAILKACNFDKLCMELMDALIAGFVVAEIVWTVRDGLVVPARVVKRARRRFKFVQLDENSPPALHLLTRGDMLRGEPVPDKKFICHRVNPEDDNPYGTGLGLQLYWPVFFKRKGIVAWNKLCDRFGSPTPHGKYPRGSGAKEKGTLADALRAMSSDGYLITPEGMEIALLESKLSGNVTTQQALCEYMDDWIGAVLTGQEARATGGGALAAASKERADVREGLTQADSDLLSETLNSTLLAWICEYNGLAPCQVYRQIKEEDDLKAMAETDKIVTDMGFEQDLDAVRAKYGEGWNKKAAPPPAPGPALPGAPPIPPKVDERTPQENERTPKAGQPANFAELSTTDALDHLVDEAMGDWRPLMAPVAQRLQALIDAATAKGETAGELIARLPQLLQELDTGALQEDLARTGFAARIGANAGIENA